MPARNDTFSIYEDDLQDGAYKALFANVFEDHGQGIDPAGAAITHINGVALTADTTDFVYLTFASGADFYIGTGGSSFPAVGPGDFKFYFGDRYDYLPAGASKTETLTYTLNDGGVSSTATVRITIKGIDSDDLFRGTAAGDAINAGIGNDKVFTYGGSDTVHGGLGDDSVQGGAGNDRLYGDAGFDTLDGGAGRDLIYGGLKQDSLIGGADADRFVFTSIIDSRSGHFDVIQDLSRKQGDRVDLKEIDANTKLAADQAFTFIGDAAFTHHAGELRYLTMGNAVLVQGDVNGDGTADLEIMLNKIVAAKASDFIL